MVYTPRYYSCGTVECQVSGANIDFSDPRTISWIKAADANAVDKMGKALVLGSIASTGGASGLMAGGSSVAEIGRAHV